MEWLFLGITGGRRGPRWPIFPRSGCPYTVRRPKVEFWEEKNFFLRAIKNPGGPQSRGESRRGGPERTYSPPCRLAYFNQTDYFNKSDQFNTAAYFNILRVVFRILFLFSVCFSALLLLPFFLSRSPCLLSVAHTAALGALCGSLWRSGCSALLLSLLCFWLLWWAFLVKPSVAPCVAPCVALCRGWVFGWQTPCSRLWCSLAAFCGWVWGSCRGSCRGCVAAPPIGVCCWGGSSGKRFFFRLFPCG